ncbi:hypothetical protein [Sicyoidochytrium minutum DNA virus]|nr:hypothetical protein [Sicyoidochytrium minutum DNA virus]
MMYESRMGATSTAGQLFNWAVYLFYLAALGAAIALIVFGFRLKSDIDSTSTVALDDFKYNVDGAFYSSIIVISFIVLVVLLRIWKWIMS